METDYWSEIIIAEHAAKMQAMRERLERTCIEKKHDYLTMDGYHWDTVYILRNDYTIALNSSSPIISEEYCFGQYRRSAYCKIMRTSGESLPMMMVNDVGEKVASSTDRYPKMYFHHYTIGQNKNERHLNRVTWLALRKFLEKHPWEEVYALTCGRLWHLKYILDTYLDPTT